MALGLWNCLSPEVARKSSGGAAKDADEVIFPGLNCLLCDVSPVVVGGNNLIGHSRRSNLIFVALRYIVVEDLMLGDDALGLHAG